jgi:hypothetical protein
MSVKLKVSVRPKPPVDLGGLRLFFEPKVIKIKISNEPHKKELSIKARRNLAGDIILYGHPEVDILISPPKTKISVIPKEKISDDTYDIQDKVFKYLTRNGIVDPSTIQASSAYGILEAKYYVNEEVNSLGIILVELNYFIEKDKENYVYDEVFEKMEKEMLEPSDENSTELGEIPHEEMQGSLRPGYIYPYGTYGAMGLYRI